MEAVTIYRQLDTTQLKGNTYEKIKDSTDDSEINSRYVTEEGSNRQSDSQEVVKDEADEKQFFQEIEAKGSSSCKSDGTYGDVKYEQDGSTSLQTDDTKDGIKYETGYTQENMKHATHGTTDPQSDYIRRRFGNGPNEDTNCHSADTQTDITYEKSEFTKHLPDATQERIKEKAHGHPSCQSSDTQIDIKYGIYDKSIPQSDETQGSNQYRSGESFSCHVVDAQTENKDVVEGSSTGDTWTDKGHGETEDECPKCQSDKTPVNNKFQSKTKSMCRKSVNNTNHNGTDTLYKPVPKLQVHTSNQKKVSQLAFKLKRLAHDGSRSMLDAVLKTVTARYSRHMQDLSNGTSVVQGMNIADMQFVVLEAEVMSRRVMYDVSLSGSDVFQNIERVVPFTSNPTLSSMTYLARLGSAVAMTTTVDEGLVYLQYAKRHAGVITPCMETGMVFYIEVNLLTQKYEQNPTIEMKDAVLKTAHMTLSQFADEEERIRLDYERMILLKIVFCHLGIGLFGNKIKGIAISNNDLDVAKKYLDFIESKNVWEGMEKRRQMLFFIAKAEFYRHQNMLDMSKIYRKQAATLARRNDWTKELENIVHIIE